MLEMPVPTESYRPVSTDPNTLANLLKALADPNRLKILKNLMEGELTEKILVARLMTPQPRIARHLAYLKRSGLVTVRREGRYAICSLNPLSPVLEDLIHWVNYLGRAACPDAKAA